MLSIVVPVYNEEKNIGRTLEELKDTLEKLGDFEIIVVNDGSTDNTLQVLAKTDGKGICAQKRNYAIKGANYRVY